MAAKWVNSNVLDSGLNYIKSNATKMYLLKAYVAGDTYATVISNALNAGVTMTSTDYTLGNGASSARTLTTATGKTDSATSNSGATPDLHIAWTNGVDTVLWVTDETSNQVITSGNTINFPAAVYTSNQPT